MNEVKTLYRYEWHQFLGDLDFFSGTFAYKIKPYEFEVIKTTPCGFWLMDYMGKERWVSATGKRRFAHPTAKEAFFALIKRTRKHRDILARRLEDVDESLKNQEKQYVELYGEKVE